MFKESLLEAKKKKPSAGLTKKQKSDVAKKAKAGKDIGKKGKGFEKIASKAAKEYGSKEKGEKVAAAAMWKNIKKENVNEDLQSILTDPKNWEALYEFIVLSAKTATGYLLTKSLFGNIPAFYEAFKKYPNTDQKKRIVQYYLKHTVSPKQYPIDKLEDFIEGKNSGAVTEGEDHEVSMAQNSLKSIMQSCADLMNKLGDDERDIPGWIQDHITNAENFIDQAAQGFHELGGHEEEEEDDEEEAMINPVDEKKLTKAEKSKKEDIIKAMAMKGGGKAKMGPKQYAIATAQAIKSAE